MLVKNNQNKQDILKKIEEYNRNGRRTIAIFCDAYYPAVDGVIKAFENQAQILSKSNNVIVCVPMHKNSIENDREYLVIGVKSYYIKSLGYDCGVPNLDRFFNSVIKKARIDIIHFHSPFGLGAYAVKLSKKRKVASIGTFHSLYKINFFRSTKSKFISNVLTYIIMKVFDKSTLVLTMNEFSSKVLRDYGYHGNCSKCNGFCYK